MKWTVIRTFYGGRTLSREFKDYTAAASFYFRAKRETTIRGATLWEGEEPLLAFGGNAPRPKASEAMRSEAGRG